MKQIIRAVVILSVNAAIFFSAVSCGTTANIPAEPAAEIQIDYIPDEQFTVEGFLAGVKNLTAEKTGNLVVMHLSGDSLSADLLLDIDSK